MAAPAPPEALLALTLAECCERWGVSSRNSVKARAAALGMELLFPIQGLLFGARYLASRWEVPLWALPLSQLREAVVQVAGETIAATGPQLQAFGPQPGPASD